MDALQRFRRNYRIWAARRAAAVPIADLAEGRSAKIQGRVESDDAGATSRFTGRRGVICVTALRIKHHRVSERGNHHVEFEYIPPKAMGSAFWLVDSQGRRALVEPRNAFFAMPMRDVSDHPRVNADTPDIRSLLAGYGVVSTLFIGVGEEVQFLETIIEPGDTLAVVGIPTMHAVRIPGSEDSYRDQAVVVPHFKSTEETPLIVLAARPTQALG